VTLVKGKEKNGRAVHQNETTPGEAGPQSGTVPVRPKTPRGAGVP
jgi:hypothetical protein